MRWQKSKPQRRTNNLARLIAILAATSILNHLHLTGPRCALAAADNPAAGAHAQSGESPDRGSHASRIGDSQPLRTEQAIQRSRGCVVAIARVRLGSVADPDDPAFRPSALAAGVIIDPSGLLVTTQRVVDDPTVHQYLVWAPNGTGNRVEIYREITVVATDPWTDLAVLRIENPPNADQRELTFPAIQLGDASPLTVGDSAVVWGQPFAVIRDGEAVAAPAVLVRTDQSDRVGNHSALRSEFLQNEESLHQYGTLLELETQLRALSSGGAVVDLDGRLVGLTRVLNDSAAHNTVFAIPVDETFRRAIEQLTEGRVPEFGFLGVGPRDLGSQQLHRGRGGVQVGEVIRGTPAHRAGFQFGDIITHIDGAPINDSMQLMRELGRRRPGDEVELIYLRDAYGLRPGRTSTTVVELSKKPLPPHLVGYATAAMPTWRGLTVDYATAFVGFQLKSRWIDADGCIAIISVEIDSPAWQAGLRPEMFISHVDGVRVSHPDDFWREIADRYEEVELTLTEGPTGFAPTIRIGTERAVGDD